MALEDRVKALEEEVAILKGQIHSTLLEIQEQVLIHYYPDLRAQGTAPEAAGTVQGARRREASSRDMPQSRPLPAEALPGDDRGRSPGPGCEPGGNGRPHATGPALGLDPLAGGSQGPDALDWATITRLMAWATQSVQRIGRTRTAKAIELSARGGHIDAGVEETLLQFIALSDLELEVKQVGVEASREVLSSLNEVLGRADSEIEALWLAGEADGG